MFKIDEALANEENLYSFDTQTQRLAFLYKDELQEAYNTLWGTLFPDLNLDESTPQGQIITSEIQNDLATISFLENILNSFFFGGTGIFLDMWAWNLFRVTRKEGIASSVEILITGVPTTQVTSDFTITDGTYEYTIKEAVVIPNGGSITATFTCTEVNEYIAPANTINKFVTVIDGVETINNPTQGTKATLRETDNQLFTRCATFGAIATNSSFRSIMARVAQVQGVTKLAGAENFTDNPVMFKNVELPPHSISICVLGGDVNAIGTAMQQSRATGCDMAGNTTVSIPDYGRDYEYTFYRPEEVAIKVKVDVKIDLTSPTNWEQVVKDNVVAFVENMQIASLVTQPALAKYLYRNVSSFDIVDVQFSKLAEPLGYADLQLDLTQILTISTLDIEVVQV